MVNLNFIKLGESSLGLFLCMAAALLLLPDTQLCKFPNWKFTKLGVTELLPQYLYGLIPTAFEEMQDLLYIILDVHVSGDSH